MEQAIAAIATPTGQGGICVIRLSGEHALLIADEVFAAAAGDKLTKSHGYRAHYGRFFDEDGLIDDGVALVFRAPKSYTGEDVVELSCHGGQAVARRLLQALFLKGAKPAGPGEFTKRAFLNGKLRLTDAEAVAQLIQADSLLAARMASGAREGTSLQEMQRIKEELVRLLGSLQAMMDYPEEDLEADVKLDRVIEQNVKSLEQILKRHHKEGLLRQGISVVITGRPNVGKSTLMNLLCDASASIVTEIPGTTRDVVEKRVEIDGIPFLLFDTAGLHTTDDPVEKLGIERAREKLGTASMVLAVFDSKKSRDDFTLSDTDSAVVIAVLHKKDQNWADPEWFKQKFDWVVETEQNDRKSIEALRRVMVKASGAAGLDPYAPTVFSERQRDCAKRARDCLQEALVAVRQQVTWDAVSVVLEEALDSLMELTGENVSEAVVEEIFSHFCVGK